MRSHVVANSSEPIDKFDSNMKRVPQFGLQSSSSTMNESKVVEFGNGQTSYGLRENPRKSWRAVGATFPLQQERICKQCGKGFQSLKALCGHMACHSERDKGGLRDDHSWTSETHKLVLDSQSDTEAEDRILRTRSSSKISKKFKKMIVNVKYPFSLVATNNASSSVSEVDVEEQEEVALCLMMLSRDSNKGGVNSVVESSDNNSVILETKSSSIDMRTRKTEAALKKKVDQLPHVNKIGYIKSLDAEIENSDSGYFLDECAKDESDVSFDGFRRNNSFTIECNKAPLYMTRQGYSDEFLNRSKSYRAELNREQRRENEYDNGQFESRKRRYNISENHQLYNEYDRIETNAEVSQKRSKYECFNCKKTFKSYQALGGHKPCHKRSNAFYEPRYESGENSLEDDSAEFLTMDKNLKSSSNRKLSADKKMKAKKNNKVHICPFCNRVFKNGQALGGHKRSHFIGGHLVSNNRSPVIAKPDLLDLNLPAPVEEDDDDDDDEDDDGNEQFSPM